MSWMDGYWAYRGVSNTTSVASIDTTWGGIEERVVCALVEVSKILYKCACGNRPNEKSMLSRQCGSNLP